MDRIGLFALVFLIFYLILIVFGALMKRIIG